MMNLRKKNEEIKRLKQLVATQKDTIKKAMELIDYFADQYIKLQDENKHLNDLVEFHKYMRSSADDIDFPNSEKGGKANPDRPDNCPDFSDF